MGLRRKPPSAPSLLGLGACSSLRGCSALRLKLPENLMVPTPARATWPPRLVPLTGLTASGLTGRSIYFERLLSLPVWHTPRVSVWLPPVLLHGLLALSSCLTALFHGPLALSA